MLVLFRFVAGASCLIFFVFFHQFRLLTLDRFYLAFDSKLLPRDAVGELPFNYIGKFNSVKLIDKFNSVWLNFFLALDSKQLEMDAAMRCQLPFTLHCQI